MRPWLFALAIACGQAPPAVQVTPTEAVDLGSTAMVGRSLKRMDIDQLDASLVQLTGVRWTEVVDGETVALFEELSGSLGKPDYQASTDEDRTPGLLFEKFLDDAARKTCRELVAREQSPGAEDRRFLVHAQLIDRPGTGDAAIDANLSEALLRFHGHRATDEERAAWRGLFDAVHDATGDTAESWRAVCVALLTHPSFYGY